MLDSVLDKSLPKPATPAEHDGQPITLSQILNITSALQGGEGLPEISHLKSTTVPLPGLDIPPSKATPLADKAKLPPPLVAPPLVESGRAASGKQTDHPPDGDGESKVDKVAREGLVIGGGLGRSFVYGMASLPNRVPEISASMAIGAGLSTLSKSGEFGAAATLVVGAYFTSKFIVNALNDTARWDKLGSAVADTWHSNQHIMKDLRAVSDSGGDFAFDTGLSYASGYIGYKNKAVAELLLSVIKLPLPVPPAIPTKFPLPPALMGATTYMAVVPAPFLYRSSRDYDANHSHSTR